MTQHAHSTFFTTRRFSTQCYMLEQQLAGEPSAAANAAATQAQTTAQQLQAAIQQMSDKRVAHRLQVRLRCATCAM